MHQNEALTSHNRKLKQEIEMHKQMQQEFAKKTQVYQRLLKKLNDKIRIKEERQRDNAQKMLLRDKELSDELMNTDEVVKQMNTKVQLLETALQRTKRNNEELRKELIRSRSRDVQTTDLKDELVAALLAAGDDIRNSLLQRGPEDLFSREDFAQPAPTLLPVRNRSPPKSFTELSPQGRMRLVELLLDRLRSQKLVILQQAQAEAARANVQPLPPIKQTNYTMAQSRSEPQLGGPITMRDNIAITSPTSRLNGDLGKLKPQDVAQPLRSWGQRSKELPMTMHGQDTYLQKGKPNSSKPWQY